MVVFKCEKPNDCPLIVRLYAKMGLHRYNMLQGTNLQLYSVEKYNKKGGSLVLPASFYITCVAEDPATGSLVHFQTSSHELTKHDLYVRFYVVRPKNTGTVGTLWNDQTAPQFYHLQHKLSDLKIVEVMVETKGKDAKLKGFIDATVYIKYHQDLRDGRVCKRRAILADSWI
ncbi:UPF0725 protein At1g02770-like [Eutrema salsugineum]|uniref:UPF0725 protein At1g02770-like n=1 Tax=Eutrema salsugineum TaxID=72664 RepID=UPI000CED239D|nr:UPF0725 protein At1g02770-like [Eutrema salsugineum]